MPASSEERLRERDLADLSDDERLAAQRLIERMRIPAETRRARRRKAAPRGDRLALARTLRAAHRTEGELLARRWSLRAERLRPLIFLCDVSGSMVPYARALIHYARTIRRARPRVHAFAFATRLTEIARIDPPDLGGGTRIGAALRAFNRVYGERGLARGGTVVVLSDGWEREDPDLVRSEMQRLSRLTRRIVWVNPQKKHPAYEPLARGMAAALPFVDAFVAGHNLSALDAIADAIERGLE
ncbi:MAG: VWA domain-containing protein [Candidatus Eremiobacteraeota bacterium]|nr:VWA domain-containing protein [Candidatus Eremiobacteraeota bacterium]